MTTEFLLMPSRTMHGDAGYDEAESDDPVDVGEQAEFPQQPAQSDDDQRDRQRRVSHGIVLRRDSQRRLRELGTRPSIRTVTTFPSAPRSGNDWRAGADYAALTLRRDVRLRAGQSPCHRPHFVTRSSPQPSLAACAVHAGDPASCTEIADDRARLACYDASLARGTNAHAVPPAVSAARVAARRRDRCARARDATSGERSLIGERWSRYGPAPGIPVSRAAAQSELPDAAPFRPASNETPSSPTHPTVDTGRDIQRDELEFQVSFKARLWESADHFYAAWLGYTQQSNWQAFNARAVATVSRIGLSARADVRRATRHAARRGACAGNC